MLLLFLYNGLILFNSCSDFTDFYSCCRIHNTTWIAVNEANAEIETQPVTIEAKVSKCST